MSQSITGKNLVFLIGAPRSGTTWLQLMLSASPAVATANETHLFSQFLTSPFDAWGRLKRAPREIGLSPLMDEQEFHGALRHVADEVMARIAARKPGATVILEKTPDHARFWQRILAVYPDARFLHLVRDPRAVVASLRAAGRAWGRDWAVSSLVDICTRWRLYVEDARRIRDAGGHMIEVRYRDLKDDGVSELRRIFAWMGVSASAEDCTAILERHRIDQLQAGRLADAPWDLSKEPEQFYRRGEAYGWKDELTRSQIYLIESMTADFMEIYGFPRGPRPRFSTRFLALQLLLGFERVRFGLRWRARRLANALAPRV